jgi:hypothetical protein
MRKFMPVVIAAAIGAALVISTVSIAAAQEQPGGPTATASIVKVERVTPPRRKVVHVKFHPWGKPSAGQVREIVAAESRRYGIPAASLARRIACESRFRWYASNGTYFGLLQFAPSTFYRGIRTLRSRSVRLVRQKLRKVRGARITHFSDGRVERKRGRVRRQRLVIVYTGRLPRRPALTHGWTQVRIGAQAIRGISAVHSSEWGCSA